MKKIIYSAAAMALAFFAGSCQRENLEPVGGNTVTYTVQVPGALATKSADDFVLTYEVYRAGEVGQVDEPAARPIYEGTKEFQNDKAELSLEFVKDQNFVVLFWAQKEGAPYNINDLRKVSLTALTANDLKAEVFSGIDNVNNCESVKGGVVELVRPIAQLNVATLTSGLTVGTASSHSTVIPLTFNMTVNGLWSSYNVATGNVNESAGNISLAESGVSGGEFKTDYTLMGMNYIGFIPKDGTNVTVDFNIVTKNDGTINHVVSNVPLKPNYRTNILGNLVSASDNYTVTLDEEWGDAGKDMEVLTDGLVRNINGDYEVSSEVGLAYAINNLFVANGVANSAAFYIKPAIYDMSQQAINDVVVSSGTLKVYDTEAVVTRSATFGSVVITGLNKPLITTVEEDATVFFSGITIQNYEGADGSAALVGNNEGKVVLTDCGIVDENGNQDEETPLVKGKDPVVVEKVEEPADGLIYTAAQLAAAFAADTVETIVLGADIALEETLVFPKGREAVLDLRGWTITIADPEKVASTYALNNHGTLTIKDSYAIGKVSSRGIYNGYVAEGDPVAEAKLTIESGAFNAMGENGGAAIFNYGIADIKGGSFTSIGGYSLNNQQGSQMTIADGVTANNGVYSSNAKLTINGGNISGNRSGCHVVYCWNTEVTINGGEFYNNNSGNSTVMAAGTTTIVYNGGTFGIKDGRVEGNGNTWTSCLLDSQNTATSEITGGTFTGGFRVQAGTSMTITGGTFNDCTGSNYNIYGTVSITGGKYTDDTAKAFATKYAHKDYKLVDETVVPKVYTVQVGDKTYETVQEAVDAAEAGSTITFLTDVMQVDGVLITDKNLTIDLNDKTFTVSKGANTNNRNFKINGSSVVTIKNGTMVAQDENSTGAYGTVRTEGTANVTLTDVKLYNYRGNGLNVKACSGTTVTISDTEIYSQYGGGIESAGGTIELTNVKVDQKGMYTAPYNSMAISVNGGGTVTVNSGTYSTECITAEEANNQGTSHGPWCAGVLNSGGTLIIKGGTFSNDNFGDNSLATYARGLLLADTGANIQIQGGIFNAVKAIVDVTNNLGDATRNPSVTLAGGEFSADPRVSGLYASHLISVVEGKDAVKGADGRWTLVKVQANNEIWYTSEEIKLEPTNPDALDANIVSNVWDSKTGKGVITFDKPLTTIGNEAFKRITNTTPSNWATSISLPKTVTTIGNYAFSQCYSLTNITIPDSVTSIGQNAFQSCDVVTTVTIGSSITTIGSSAFYNCYEIKEIVCKATTPPALEDKWVFNGVSKDIKVVVPATALDTYKAAEHWKSFTNIVAE